VKHVILFTDGSCLGNPGPGGWAFLFRCGSVETEHSGTALHTTNNRMELQAVIAGLSALKEPCAVRVVTDSQYIQRAMTRHLERWIARGWLNSHGVLVSNRDLWEALLRESSRHQVTWTWIRGHGASAEQNRCDALAHAAARSLLVLAG
jgi:ribonuclease HI